MSRNDEVRAPRTQDRHPASGGAAPATRSGRRKSYRLWFAIPSIAMILLFFAIPFVANAVFAFMRWTGYSNTISWDGLSNFASLIQLGVLGHAIRVTVIFAIVTMIVQNVVGLVLAKALQGGTRTDTFFRSIYFIPVLFSPLAAGYIWAAMLQPHGPVNSAIALVIPGFDFAWLGHATSALITVGAINAWKWSGLVTLVYIAGLNRIPRPVLEAGYLDGAGMWKRFWGIEFPLLAPSFTFNVVITFVGAFSSLDVVFATTGGGPGDATTVLNAELYAQYADGLFGMASALGLVVTIMVIITAVPLIGWLRRREVTM